MQEDVKNMKYWQGLYNIVVILFDTILDKCI